MAWARWRQLAGLPSRVHQHAQRLIHFMRELEEREQIQRTLEAQLFDRVRQDPPVPSPFAPPYPAPDVVGPIRDERRPINYINLLLPDGDSLPVIPLLRLPLMTPGTWTDDDPGAGSVAWTGCQVAHEGEIYEIEDGNTADAYIYWDKSVDELAFQTSAAKPTIDPTEDLLICYNNSGTAELAFLANLIQAGLIVCQQLSALSADLGLVTAGEIRLGSGTPGVDYTGIRIYKANGTYRVAGYSNDVLQAYMDSDGKVKAGGGGLVLDADGLTLMTGLGTPSYVEWKDGNGILRVYVLGDGTADAEDASLDLRLHDQFGATELSLIMSQALGLRISGPGNIDLDEMELLVNALNESVADAGVTVEAVELKDGEVDGVVVDAHAARHQNGGGDEVGVAALSGLLADDQHVLDAEVLAVAASLATYNAHDHSPGVPNPDPTQVDHSFLLGVTEAQHHDHSVLVLGAPTELTIAGGVITVTQSNHIVDTQGDAGSDDLDTINGGVDGMILCLRQVVGTRDVVIKHSTGNIVLPNGNDITLDIVRDMITLVYHADITKWACINGALI